MTAQKPGIARRTIIGAIGAFGIAAVGGIIGRGVGGAVQGAVNLVSPPTKKNQNEETPITTTATAVGAGLGVSALIKSAYSDSQSPPEPQ